MPLAQMNKGKQSTGIGGQLAQPLKLSIKHDESHESYSYELISIVKLYFA